MSEINFLVDLILNHKLPLATKKVIAERLKLVSEQAAPRQTGYIPPPQHQIAPSASMQAPSTLANMAKHPDLMAQIQGQQQVPPPRPDEQAIIDQQQARMAQPVVVATAAAAAAMASRDAAISASLSGKIDKQTGRPRKF